LHSLLAKRRPAGAAANQRPTLPNGTCGRRSVAAAGEVPPPLRVFPPVLGNINLATLRRYIVLPASSLGSRQTWKKNRLFPARRFCPRRAAHVDTKEGRPVATSGRLRAAKAGCVCLCPSPSLLALSPPHLRRAVLDSLIWQSREATSARPSPTSANILAAVPPPRSLSPGICHRRPLRPDSPKPPLGCGKTKPALCYAIRSLLLPFACLTTLPGSAPPPVAPARPWFASPSTTKHCNHSSFSPSI
jgi:hypothetical protein